MSLASGSRLGPYEIVSPLGAGAWARCIGPATRGSGARWAQDPRGHPLQRSGAPRPIRAGSARRRRAQSPSILSVFDVGAENEVSYIATELVSGETLAALVARGPLPVRTLLDIAVQIADGLADCMPRSAGPAVW
jgi:eukaryotic-like serine/threonine-protein kinase